MNIVSLSGGKDSTAMLLMMLEKSLPIDEIIFCDTGKEFPQMYEHLNKLGKYISDKYGQKITRLRAEKSFDYYMYEHVKKRGKHKGEKGYGWADMRVRWCTSFFKRDVIKKYLKGKTYTLYIGIARDEEKRHAKKAENIVHPLYDWGITEQQALEYCYSKGFDWGGLYKLFKRVSCWCCPLQSLNDLRMLYRYFPNLWRELMQMDNRPHIRKFRKDYTVQELEEKFKNE